MNEGEQLLGRGECKCLNGTEKGEILEGLEMLLQKRTEKLENEKRDEYIRVLTTMKLVTEKIIKKVENTPDCRY